MIYVDDLHAWNRFGTWCHCWSDTGTEELRQFAAEIGVHRALHYSSGLSGEFLHIDLNGKLERDAALENGAVYIPLREWIKARMDGKTTDQLREYAQLLAARGHEPR